MLILLYAGWHLLRVVEIVYVSALFAVVLSPVVAQITTWRIHNWRPSRPIAVVILLVGIFGALFLFFRLGLPPVMRDLKEFATDLPQRIPLVLSRIKRMPLADKLGIENITARVETAASATASYIVSSLPMWAEHLFDIVTTIILTVYFILEGDQVYAYFLSTLHAAFRRRMDATLHVAEERVSRWLIGQLILMGIQGAYSLIVFGALHIRYFVLLGILMGITNIIPIAGNLVTIVIVFGVAAADSWTHAFLVLIFYAAYTQFENAWLTPRIMKQSVDLMGIAVLIALLIGSTLAGVVGALVAVPSAALVAVLTDEFFVQKEEAVPGDRKV
jgi:predicted PurR-regulated permease PerM